MKKQVPALTAALLTVCLLASTAVHAQQATNDAAPLGLELGKTKCARLTSATNHARGTKPSWAGGDTVEIRNLDRFHLAGLTRAIVNCDAQDTVALITLTFDRSAMDEVSKKLDARYESRRKTAPDAENAYAEWLAANGSLEMLSARQSKQFTVAYWAKGAKAHYFAYSGTGASAPTADQKPSAVAPRPAPQPARL